MNLKKKLIPVLIAPLLVGLTLSGQALANDSDELEKLRALVQELDQKVRILDRKGEIASEEAAAKKKETPIVKASQDGFGLESADGKNKIRFKALAQIDYRNFQDAGAGNDAKNIDGFTFRRIRPSVEGTIADKYDFKFVPEFGENKTSGYTPGDISKVKSDSGIVDAFIDARFTPWFQVKAGKFKPYVGLERLQSAADLKFIERSYVSNNVLPNRDLGASVHGGIFNNNLEYAVGVFNGVVDGGDNITSQDLNGDKEWTARVFATPFKGQDSFLSGLGFGIAGTYGKATGSYTPFKATQNTVSGTPAYGVTAVTLEDVSKIGLPDYKTAGQQSTFFAYKSGTIADGVKSRWTPQAFYYLGPVGVIAEYARVEQDLSNGATKGKAKNDAWQVAASWLITGEDASFKGVKPKHAFDIYDNGTGWGAWELVARYQENSIDNSLNAAFADKTKYAESAQSWALGVNWYLNQNIKLATNYERTSFDKFSAAGSIQRAPEEILFSRLQISY